MTTASAGLVGACFNVDYASARAGFLAAAARAGATVDVVLNDRARAPDGSALTTDVAVLGPAESGSALLIVSGTHGPEGYIGSAAQIALLDALATSARPLSTRVVLVHAINPWGFAHVSRTTENNVDLNRNFIDWSGGVPDNPRYAELHALLCPDQWTPEALREAAARRDAWIERHGADSFLDATSRGQYTHADGLNYGGTGREWSNEALEKIIERHLAGVARIALIDWHTGLGERGEPFFLCFNEPGDAEWQRACEWWGRERIESSEGFRGGTRPNYTGLLFHGVQRYAAGARVTGAVVEFGTLGMDETRLALQADRHLKFGEPVADARRTEMRALLFDAFAPLALDWRRSVLGHAIAIQHAAVDGLERWVS